MAQAKHARETYLQKQTNHTTTNQQRYTPKNNKNKQNNKNNANKTSKQTNKQNKHTHTPHQKKHI